MRDYLTLGPSPSDEDCINVGVDNYHQLAKEECRRFKALLEERFPLPPPLTYFGIKSFPHDFGDYMEVVIYYETEDEESENFAFSVEDNAPNTWEG